MSVRCSQDAGKLYNKNNKYYLKMTEFFTPEEVQPKPVICAEEYEIEKYREDPFQPTLIKVESLSDHRRKIMQWLKGMPVPMRIQKLTYTNKQFSCLLMAMHQRLQDRNKRQYQFAIFHDRLEYILVDSRGYRLVDDRLIRQPDKQRILAEHRLMKSIVLVHHYTHFDSVTVDESLASDIDKLFELFDVIENGISHQLAAPNTFNTFQKQDSSLFYCDPRQVQGLTKTIGNWFVQVIKKNISLKFFQQNSAKQQVQLRMSKTLKLFKKHWKPLSTQQKEKIVQKVLAKNICKIVGTYRQNIRVDDHTFPRIMRSPSQEIDDFKFYIIHNNGEVLLKNLMFTHLNAAAESLSIYKYELILELQELLQKKQSEGPAKKKNSKEDPAQKIQVSPINQFNPAEEKAQKTQSKAIVSEKPTNISLGVESPIKIEMRQPKYSQGQQTKNQVSAQEKKDIYINGKKLSKKDEIKSSLNEGNLKKVVFNVQSPQRNINIQEETLNGSPSVFFNQKTKPMSEVTNDQEESSLLSRRESQEKFMEDELDKINKEIIQQAAAWGKYRELAISRIYEVLKRYSLSFKVFGSHPCGLAIPSSDIDICVDPTIVNYFIVSFREYRDKIIMALEFLRQIFRQTPWSGKFNLISTAVVPVLMFEINLGIPHGDPRQSAFNLTRRKQITIQVDFSIQLYVNMVKQINPHLGYESTLLIKQWTSQDPILAPCIILLKHVFNRFSLNKKFTGGFSSFTLVTLIYAFYLTVAKRLEIVCNISSFIKNFALFIATFDLESFYINTAAEGNPIRHKNLRDNTLTVLNPLNKKNLTENCRKFGQIKEVMRQLSESLGCTKLKSQKESKKALRSLFFN